MVRLPPFFALRALEAAARHRSYSRKLRRIHALRDWLTQEAATA